MINTAHRLAEAGIQSVIIDLTQIGTEVGADAWYLGLLTVMEDQLLLETDVLEWWQARAHLGVTQRLTQFFQTVLLTEVESPVVIFVDEIDTTLRLDFTDDFFAAIRFLYVARAQQPELQRLSFVLIGVATPGDLIRDAKRTPFNIGQRVDLTDFTLSEAMPLAAGFALAEVPAQQTLEHVLKWSNGHPYLTQRLCEALTATGAGPWSKAQVDQVVQQIFLGAQSEQDNNLQFVRDMLTKRAPEPVAVLRTYREIRRGQPPVIDEEQSLIKSHLKLSGVVRREGKQLVVRNRIYFKVFDRKWIREHLPENFWQRYKSVLRWAIPVTAASIAVAIVMTKLAAEARHQSTEAQHQRKIALENQQKAEQKEKEANDQARMTQIALEREQKAKQALQAALTEANKQKQRAEQQTHIAQEQQIRAEQQKLKAEEQTLIAQQERQLAEQQKSIVQRQTTVAQLREQAATVLNWLPTPRATDALISAIDVLYRSEKFASSVLPTAQTNLLSAVQEAIELNRFQGHQSTVNSVAFSPDGSRIVSGSDDKTLRLWDARTGQAIGQPLTGHQSAVWSVAFSPDGSRIVSGSSDNTVRVWDARGNWLTVACNRLKYHPLLNQPEAVTSDKEFIAIVKRAKAVCEQRVWNHPTISAQKHANWFDRAIHRIAEIFFG
jgi:flagellar biosynthesis GTPase FlhF